MLGQNAFALVRSMCFVLVTVVMLILVMVAVNHKIKDPWHQPFAKITDSLEPAPSGRPFDSDDFFVANQSDSSLAAETESLSCDDKAHEPINCEDPDLFILLMSAALENLKDVEFYQFGRPVRGNDNSSCHLAWRGKPSGQDGAEISKDYRSFEVVRTENCTFRVVHIGDHHSGENALNRKNSKNMESESNPIALPRRGEILNNDAFLDMGSNDSFSLDKYLVYLGGEDRCKNMHQYLWSFLCMLGEAQYLNRTLVMDLSICLSQVHSSSGREEEGRDFRYYFDFEHLMDSASVLDQAQFWLDWNTSREKNGLTLYFVEDHLNVTPMKLVGLNDTLIVRKFGSVEPNNYWFQVCEGEAKTVIDRPWRMIWKSRPLLDVAFAIAARMKWDFDAVHVERGDKAANTELWPNLARDTSPESLLATLKDKIDGGRELYVASNERNESFFDPLKSKYSVQFLDKHKDLWDENSDWYAETTKLSNGIPVEFDNFMRHSVDSEVFSRGMKRLETFNDLTRDCKDGINTCSPAN